MNIETNTRITSLDILSSQVEFIDTERLTATLTFEMSFYLCEHTSFCQSCDVELLEQWSVDVKFDTT